QPNEFAVRRLFGKQRSAVYDEERAWQGLSCTPAEQIRQNEARVALWEKSCRHLWDRRIEGFPWNCGARGCPNRCPHAESSGQSHPQSAASELFGALAQLP